MAILERDPQTLGERLALVRKEHGITQWQTAQLLGVSRSRVTDYEHGRKVPLSVLATFCEVFVVRWYWLTCGIGAKEKHLSMHGGAFR